MDGNKDDALKCLNIGKNALESGDQARALKFITKARRLDPSLPVEDLLKDIQKESVNERAKDANGPSVTTSSSDRPSIRKRVSSTDSSSSSTSPSSAGGYTQEQIAVVRDIRKKKNFYEILGLEKSCSIEDVRKAYRKLSLKVHPDKNKAPGAEEAFKAVSKAFQCLSDEETRKRYDLVGDESTLNEWRPARRASHGFNGFYEAEIDPEEIFRNFFFGGMAPAGGFGFGPGMGHTHRATGHGGSGGFNMRGLIQLLPVLVILLLNFLPSSEPIYALSRSYPYEYRFTTQKGVNFYVKSTKFEQDYPPNTSERASLEAKVEREYFSILSQNCRLELQRRQWGFIQETPHCDMLQKYNPVAS